MKYLFTVSMNTNFKINAFQIRYTGFGDLSTDDRQIRLLRDCHDGHANVVSYHFKYKIYIYIQYTTFIMEQ